MNKTLIRLLGLLLALAMVAAACGDDDAEGGDSADGDVSTDDSGDDGDSADDSSDDASDDSADDSSDASDDAADDSSDDASDDTADDSGDDAPAEELIASDIGVTEDTIRIGILIADLQGLRDVGFPLPEALTNEHLVSRWTNYFDRWNVAGGINGRMVEGVEITWDPLDPATMQDSCTKGTLDEELFMTVNASGFNTSFIPCFTVDADQLFFYGEVASQELIDQSPNRLFALNPPAEVAGEVGTQLALDQGIIEDGAKVGILSGSSASQQAAAVSAETLLADAGHESVVIEVNTNSDDNAAINAESSAAVSQFSADGVGHVLAILPFTQGDGFWGEVGELSPDWGITLLDAASSNCTPFGASRTNPAAEGAICVTSYDSYADPAGGLVDDDEYEAACRATWIEDFGDVFAGASDPGVPSGDVIETADGETIYSDYAPGECTMTALIEQALTNAGVNPTRDSFAEAMKQLSGPQAFRSNGEGAFGPDKNFFSTQMWAVQFTIVPADTPRGDDGTFLGCPAPTNCWRPVTGEWLPLP